MATRETPRFSRRRMLQGTALVLGSLSGSAILAACGGQPAPPAAPKAEAPKPAAPAATPAATTAPASKP
ncbi:MAG: hypothetical protein M3O34_12860, partial [Chloroflexota bacterium]|nr:hypothetical protein [Chloroflexota bacterium]